MINMDYQITALRQVYHMVEMSLQPYRPPPSPEEFERARAEAELEPPEPIPGEAEAAEKIIGPIPVTDDEKMVEGVVKAYKKFIPGMARLFKDLDPMFPASGMAIGPTKMEMCQQLYLTVDQYTALGSPPLFSIITLTAEVKPNG